MGYLSLQDVGSLICRGAFHRVFRDSMPTPSVKDIKFMSAVLEWERQPAENSWLICNERGLISVIEEEKKNNFTYESPTDSHKLALNYRANV